MNLSPGGSCCCHSQLTLGQKIIKKNKQNTLNK